VGSAKSGGADAVGTGVAEGTLVKEEAPAGFCFSPAGAFKLGGRGLGRTCGRSVFELDPGIAGLDVGL